MMEDENGGPLGSPHGKALGVEMTGDTDGVCTVRVPWAEHLVGDPDTGVLHGGVITATLDNASGMAVRCHPEFEDGQSMATLDLRIDYMKPAEPHTDLVVEAECYKLTRNVAFVRGLAWQGTRDNSVAASVGTFMLGTRSEPRP